MGHYHNDNNDLRRTVLKELPETSLVKPFEPRHNSVTRNKKILFNSVKRLRKKPKRFGHKGLCPKRLYFLQSATQTQNCLLVPFLQ